MIQYLSIATKKNGNWRKTSVTTEDFNHEHDISKGIDVPKGGSYPLDVPSLKFLRLSG